MAGPIGHVGTPTFRWATGESQSAVSGILVATPDASIFTRKLNPLRERAAGDQFTVLVCTAGPSTRPSLTRARRPFFPHLNAPPISAPDVPILTLPAMPQSEPREERNSSAVRMFSVNTHCERPCAQSLCSASPQPVGPGAGENAREGFLADDGSAGVIVGSTNCSPMSGRRLLPYPPRRLR